MVVVVVVVEGNTKFTNDVALLHRQPSGDTVGLRTTTLSGSKVLGWLAGWLAVERRATMLS